MDAQIPDKLKRAIKVSLLLSAISSFIVFSIGWGTMKMNTDIKVLSRFLVNAENAQPNFEKSLILYTEKTKDIIVYLLQLRPGKKEEYVNFISQIEKIGQDLNLNLNLESVTTSKSEITAEGEDTIDYNMSFYGSETDVITLLRKLEQLPYFVKIDEIGYKDIKKLSDEEKKLPNVFIRIRLYIKQQAVQTTESETPTI